jgi:hypothetical protein
MDSDGKDGNRRPARVELVDNWSDRWKEALGLLEELGQREVLRLDEEGWLPARQNLLVAFKGEVAVGYLCFEVRPVMEDGAVKVEVGRAVMEAVVDGEGSVGEDRAVVRQLREAAMHRALELRCARFRWERAEASV